MRIAVRADASRWIGSGHVRRVVTLGEELMRQGAEVHLISRSMPGDQCDYARSHGLEVHRLAAVDCPRPPTSGRGLAHEHWLGVAADEERHEAEAVIKGLRAAGTIDWLVVDHYALDARWEGAMRPHVDRMMAIDDLADRRHAVDVLLDQNEWPDGATRYGGLVDPDTVQLVGARYALLGPEYAELRSQVTARAAPIRRVVIFFGPTDGRNLTGMALEAVHKAGGGELHVDVVLGRNHPHRDDVWQQAKDAPSVQVHDEVPSLAGLMATADLALGAGGTTSWERCALGLPTIVVTMAANQDPVGRALAAQGLGWLVGTAEQVGQEDLESAIRHALATDDYGAIAGRCRDLVDGRGAARVAAILGSWSQPMRDGGLVE